MRRGLFPRSKMAPKKRKADNSGNEARDTTPESPERDKYFTWTDEETALLLKVAISYKTEKTTVHIPTNNNTFLSLHLKV